MIEVLLIGDSLASDMTGGSMPAMMYAGLILIISKIRGICHLTYEIDDSRII